MPSNSFSYIFIVNGYGGGSITVSFNYVNDDSSKYISLTRGTHDVNIIVLHPSNGSHIATKIIDNPTSNQISQMHGNGRYSNNILLIHITEIVGTTFYNYLTFVNTDDWNVTTYTSGLLRRLYNFAPMFSTDQVILLINNIFSSRQYTIQAAYDKLHMTEFYTT